MKWFERMKQSLSSQTATPRDPMEGELAKWGRLYQRGKTTGQGSLLLPSAIAGELARLAVCELDSWVEGGSRGQFLQKQYRQALGQLRLWAEYGFALGGMVLKVYPEGGRLVTQCIRAQCFTPLAYGSDGSITAAEFTEEAQVGGQRYRRVERHRLEGQQYEITNTALDSQGKAVPLEAVPQWSGLVAGVTLEGISRPLFVYFRTPMANCLYPESPLGVSVFAGVCDLIDQAEEQWERIRWEYQGSELAIDASEDLFEHRRDGSVVLPQGKERLFRAHDIDLGQSGGRFLEVFSPTIRDSALFCGLNNILRRIEFGCGLAYGTLSDPANVERTAQEVRAGKQRSYTTICDLQAALEQSLTQLVEVMDIWASLEGLCRRGEYKLHFGWGDSVVTDSDTLRQQHRLDVAAGLMSPEEYRSVWYSRAAQTRGGEDR